MGIIDENQTYHSVTLNRQAHGNKAIMGEFPLIMAFCCTQ